MRSVIVATKNEELRLATYEALASIGHFPECVSSWPECIRALTATNTKFLFIDRRMSNERGELLMSLAATLSHKPTVKIFHSDGSMWSQFPDLTNELGPPPATYGLSPAERDLVPLLGWGPNGFEYLGRIAKSRLAIRIYGERGTGKEALARMIHALRGVDGGFEVVSPGREPLFIGDAPGTIFFEALDKHGLQSVRAARERAKEMGWHCIGGSRQLHSDERDGQDWVHIKLRPLRECPKDVRPLTKLFLEAYRRRLGIPKRRVHGKLWALIDRYPWPGNRRELEAFVVQAITSARGTYITPNTLPPAAVDLLKSGFKTATATQSYELMVEERLRPVVNHYQPSKDTPSLYRLVMDATERALIRLVLNHNGGNQKTAASRLGVARNTLRSRISRLDPYGDIQ